MIIKHNNWHDSNEFDDEFNKFFSILDKFEDKIRRNNCTWTTSTTHTKYEISSITDENYLYEYHLGKVFYGEDEFGLYSRTNIKGETDLDKVMTSLENIMLCVDDYEKFKKELEKNGFEYEE